MFEPSKIIRYCIAYLFVILCLIVTFAILNGLYFAFFVDSSF